jgi:hypothetical protein
METSKRNETTPTSADPIATKTLSGARVPLACHGLSGRPAKPAASNNTAERTDMPYPIVIFGSADFIIPWALSTVGDDAEEAMIRKLSFAPVMPQARDIAPTISDTPAPI